MNFTNTATGDTISIRADNIVSGPEGNLLVEAMFSGIVDLTSPSANVAARLHPAKARTFEWVVTRQPLSVVPTGYQEGSSVLTPGLAIEGIVDVEIHVNKPAGGTLARHFSEYLDRSRRLLEHGSDEDVRSTTAISGFDLGAEPIMREMRDGSLLLIFGFIPPLVTEQDSIKAQRFDINRFGVEIGDAVGVPLVWGDREVFVVQQPQSDTGERIRKFLANYWHDTKRP